MCGRKEREKEVRTEDVFLCWARDALFGRKYLWLSKMLSAKSEVKKASRVPRVNNDWRQQPRSENRPNATHPCQKNIVYSYTSSRRRRRTKLGMGILMYCCKSCICLLWGQRHLYAFHHDSLRQMTMHQTNPPSALQNTQDPAP